MTSIRHCGLVLALYVAVFSSGAGAKLAAPQASSTGRVTLLRTPDGGIQPQIALAADAGVHLLYFKGEASHGDLFYVRLGRDGQFLRPIQVNSHPGSAIATGSMRGGQIAIGRAGRVHVAWHGSDRAEPRAADGSTPVLYTRLNDGGTQFEPERNLVHSAAGLDAGTIAADLTGNVYVLWHAGLPNTSGEGDRRVWITRSIDDGRTFARETAANDALTGACGCCGLSALADRTGNLYLLYRSAAEVVHRDTYLLTSRDKGHAFTSDKLQAWNVGACPMSTFSLSESARHILAAWETAGQVQWLQIDIASGRRSPVTPAPGSTNDRKHPVIARNSRGETLLAWTEGTVWNKGGAVAWQVFDQDGAATTERGRLPGVPTWGLVAIAARPDGSFVIVY